MAKPEFRHGNGKPLGRGRPERRRHGPLFVLMTGALIGLVVAGLLVWYFLPREKDFREPPSVPELRIPPTAIVTPGKPAPAADPSQPAPGATAPATKPEYTFYEILPGNQTPKPKAKKPAAPRMVWWLQVAALKDEADANALRARLILIDLAAVVQTANIDGHTLYRIRIGPFKDEDEAQDASEHLRMNNFEAKLLKEAVNP